MTSKPTKKKRLLIFVVAYNAQHTIKWVLGRVPTSLAKEFEAEILVIDDQSEDKTFEESEGFAASCKSEFKITVLFNPENQGYGGNQKVGYHYAIKNNFDFVALIHGDGQYAPEELPTLVKPLAFGEADAVFGSRMLSDGAALKGGMPFYKFIGNKILTFFQNYMLQTKFSEFHSGYRLYSTRALQTIPFHLNSNDFHFDTEIIIQLVFSGKKIKELPIPTYYGDEICHVNGIKYAFKVINTTLRASMQKYNLLFDRKYDCRNDEENYLPKFGFKSPHSLAIESVENRNFVLDIGSAGGFVAERLNSAKNCRVFGLDVMSPRDETYFEGFIECNLDEGLPEQAPSNVDTVLMLDVLEHLSNPEKFLEELREHFKFQADVVIHASTGNIAFAITRLLHMIGMFNYGKKGILDLTHKRLFTRKTFINLFEQNGFVVRGVEPVPAPWGLVFGSNPFGHCLTKINTFLCRVWPSMFAYQFFLTVAITPHLDLILQATQEASKRKSSLI